MNYGAFLARKAQLGEDSGFAPTWMPPFLFDFQAALVEWALRKGRAAIFADCGMGKGPMALVWAQNVVRHANRPVLILAPLAVSHQFLRESQKFGIACARSLDGRVAGEITVSNYERLPHFNPNDWGGVVCDESSIIKHFGGFTQKLLTRFLVKIPYRLLCTATAAPNDYHELGTSSEALGYLGKSDMLARFFAQTDGKAFRMNEVKLARAAKTGNHYARLAYRVSQQIGQWRLKAHAEVPFWRWACSWARACRRPSDLGFSDNGFALPCLTERDHVVIPRTPPDGMLFTLPAFGLRQERDERRRTLDERVELVRTLVSHAEPAVVWCHLNAEGDRLAKEIPGAVQVKGADPMERKEEVYDAFVRGTIRVLVTKPKIGGHGLNWQHCAHVVTFATHSWESFYQSVRRCWRFGQTREVLVDIISTEGESHVRENMARKSEAASFMFDRFVAEMHRAHGVSVHRVESPVELPTWL